MLIFHQINLHTQIIGATIFQCILGLHTSVRGPTGCGNSHRTEWPIEISGNCHYTFIGNLGHMYPCWDNINYKWNWTEFPTCTGFQSIYTFQFCNKQEGFKQASIPFQGFCYGPGVFHFTLTNKSPPAKLWNRKPGQHLPFLAGNVPLLSCLPSTDTTAFHGILKKHVSEFRILVCLICRVFYHRLKILRSWAGNIFHISAFFGILLLLIRFCPFLSLWVILILCSLESFLVLSTLGKWFRNLNLQLGLKRIEYLRLSQSRIITACTGSNTKNNLFWSGNPSSVCFILRFSWQKTIWVENKWCLVACCGKTLSMLTFFSTFFSGHFSTLSAGISFPRVCSPDLAFSRASASCTAILCSRSSPLQDTYGVVEAEEEDEGQLNSDKVSNWQPSIGSMSSGWDFVYSSDDFIFGQPVQISNPKVVLKLANWVWLRFKNATPFSLKCCPVSTWSFSFFFKAVVFLSFAVSARWAKSLKRLALAARIKGQNWPH